MAKLSNTFGFIGCGNLAQAVISGAVGTKALRPDRVKVCDRSQKKAKDFAKKTKTKFLNSNLDLVKNSQYIFLATKPQDLRSVLGEISNSVTKDHVIVSLAAGVEASLIKKIIPQAGGVVRVMANTPAQINQGIYGIYFLKANGKVRKTISNIFSKIGTVVALKSDGEVDAITSGSASGVGFVFEFMRIFEKWFMSQGFSKKTAREIVAQTFLGTAMLAQKQQDISFEALREMVTSKKGTTFSGLRSMKSKGLEAAIQAGLKSAKSRAREISNSLRKASK